MPFNTYKKLISLAVISSSLCLGACEKPSQTTAPEKTQEPLSVKNSVPATSTEFKTDITLWPTLKAPNTFDANVEQRVKALLDKMTLEQKIGQMAQAEITWVTPEEVKQYHLGSVLNGGGTYLHGKRHAGIDEWVSYMDSIYDASMDTSAGGLAIPVTYGIDAVHGNNKFGGATIFPHNIGLGATRNTDLLKRIGEITALEVLVTGIDWTFAPTLAVVRDDRWGRTYEGYSEDPKIVAEFAKAMVEGLQGVAGTANFLDDHHVYATAKHWVGDGGTDKGKDQGDNTMSEQELIKTQAAGYFPALEAGIQSVMASHNGWHGEKLHGHKYLLDDVLKQKLNFDGFIVGDWNAHGNVKGCNNTSCAKAINAGLDMFMVVEDYKEFIATTIKEVNSGMIAESRINDAVSRILRVKIRSGLFEKGRPSGRPYSGKAELMGSEAHREVARQAVRESLVLLKNNGHVLPIDRNKRILVAGDGADNMAKQAGGWTIGWQGNDNTKADFVGASTILDGIRSTVKAGGGTVEYAADGNFTTKPDIAIVVFGENPYAEWQGDLKTIAYKPFSTQDAELLEKLQAKGIPIVSVFLSGRPLWVNREINASDAFVAAWLPGSEGKAVADVLFKTNEGAINADFKGKLSYSWPRKASQVVLNVGDSDYDPLFAYGYGLSYADSLDPKFQIAKLDTTNDFVVKPDFNAPYDILVGTISKPWQVLIDSPTGKVYVEKTRMETAEASIMEADYKVQGDAQEFQWNGSAASYIGFSSSWFRDTLGSYIHAGGALNFDVRTIVKPEGKIKLNMGCASGYCGDVDISALLKPTATKEWASISVSLACFARQGVEFGRSNAPFMVYSDKKATLRFANVRFLSKMETPVDIECK